MTSAASAGIRRMRITSSSSRRTCSSNVGFNIEISEVGPAEYPLLEVLRDTVFGEFGHVSKTTVATQLADQRHLIVLVAHLEGNPIGFSAGYRRTPLAFYINYLAILRDYRQQGI